MHVLGAAVHGPGAHLVGGTIGKRSDYRDGGLRRGEREHPALILEQHDTFDGGAPGHIQ